MVRDSVTGLLWPPVVAAGEEAAAAWEALLARALAAGLVLAEVRALVSDGAQGLLSHLRHALPWVYQQRCIFHIWRNETGAWIGLRNGPGRGRVGAVRRRGGYGHAHAPLDTRSALVDAPEP